MKKGYKFVYSLLDVNGSIFYIGCTNDIEKRYMQHIQTKSTTKVSGIIMKMLQNGTYPDIYIIHYLPSEQAIKKENELIELFSKAGHSLANNSLFGDQDRKNKPCSFKLKRNAIKAAKYQQDKYLFFFNMWEKNGYYTTNYYPEQPNFKTE